MMESSTNYASLATLVLLLAISFERCGTFNGSHSDFQHCEYDKEWYVCIDIPHDIPRNITSVMITELSDMILVNKFNDSSWRQVTRLDITGTSTYMVSGYVFANLTNLKELRLHLPKVRTLESRAFTGLINLTKLDLLDMEYLPSNTLSFIINEASLWALQDLTFDPGSVNLKPTVLLNTATIETALTNRSFKSLNIRSTLIGTTFMAVLSVLLSSVESLNISGSSLLLFDSSHHSMRQSMETLLSNLDSSRPILKTLDFSRCSYSNRPLRLSNRDAEYKPRSIQRSPIQNMTFPWYFTLIENIYSDRILRSFDVMAHASYNYSESPVFTKRISVRGNRLLRLTGNLVLNTNNTIYDLDCSDNKIVYISPGSISCMIHLKCLNLSTNRIGQMEAEKDEFGQLFKTLKELTTLDVSHNGISDIPYDMFDGNANLRTLNLSFNKLTTIMFRLVKLLHLRTLDISGNQIRVLDGDDFARLHYFANYMQNTSHKFILDLKWNPLECDCESVPFIEWLSGFSTSSRPHNVYYCELDGRSERIDQSSVDMSKYMCIRTKVIIISSTASVAVIMVVLMITGCLIRRHRNRKQLTREYLFAKAFHDGNMPEEFILFVAYASIEENIVRQVIRPLRDAFQAKLRIDRETVATGYNFRPGFRITEETFRLIKLSHVFVAVVSNPFCQSEYCIAEIHEACNQHKPVILIFVGEVEEEHMSPYLREVFKRVVRVKMVVGEDGKVDIVPGIEALCDSVMLLAVEGQN